MSGELQGYLLDWVPFPFEKGSTDKVKGLLFDTEPPTVASFKFKMPANDVPKVMFDRYFMPYAEANWPYSGSNIDCEMLATALASTYFYIDMRRKEKSVTEPLPVMVAQQKVLGMYDDLMKGIITKSGLRAVGGLARGNVRVLGTRNYDGSCYFPNHTLCKFGDKYYDPTFSQITDNVDDCVKRKINQAIGALRISRDGLNIFVYAQDKLMPAVNFSDTWWELDGDGWITVQDWTTKTTRGGMHTRTQDLRNVDAALKAFEDVGYPNFNQLKTAFQNWIKKNPSESKARNKNNCVNGLARFLGITGVNYPNVM